MATKSNSNGQPPPQHCSQGKVAHYGTVPVTQSSHLADTQNNKRPLLYQSFSQETSKRSLTSVARNSSMVRAVLVLLALALVASVVSLLSNAVWRGDSSPLRSSGVLNLRQQFVVGEETRPSQVHIALYDATAQSPSSRRVGMTVSWATATPTAKSLVRFGRTANDLSTVVEAQTKSQQYEFCEYESPWFHHVVLDGSQLEPDTTYFYQCGDPSGGWSELLTFTTATAIGDPKPTTFAVIGDLGQTEFSEQTIRHLIDEPNVTAILHAGDLSYADSYQPRWDRWGKLVEPSSSVRPWMVSVGNHEEERPCQKEVDRYVAYQQRFRMPYDPSDVSQKQNMYYGFRAGLVHFIILTPYIASDAASPQHQWLKQELGRVDRGLTPWVVIIMHGPWYNSNTAHQGHEPHIAMKTHMEELVFEYKVDLVFSGHVHAYERSFAVYKEKVRPDGTVYVVLGDGGNREGLAPTYIHPKPEWSAFRQANYGFGLFHVVNRTHAQIEMYEDQAVGNARLQDSAWLSTTQYRIATSTIAASL